MGNDYCKNTAADYYSLLIRIISSFLLHYMFGWSNSKAVTSNLSLSYDIGLMLVVINSQLLVFYAMCTLLFFLPSCIINGAWWYLVLLYSLLLLWQYAGAFWILYLQIHDMRLICSVIKWLVCVMVDIALPIKDIPMLIVCCCLIIHVKLIHSLCRSRRSSQDDWSDSSPWLNSMSYQCAWLILVVLKA